MARGSAPRPSSAALLRCPTCRSLRRPRALHYAVPLGLLWCPYGAITRVDGQPSARSRRRTRCSTAPGLFSVCVASQPRSTYVHPLPVHGASFLGEPAWLASPAESGGAIHSLVALRGEPGSHRRNPLLCAAPPNRPSGIHARPAKWPLVAATLASICSLRRSVVPALGLFAHARPT